jgi:hypothetical protein
LPEPMGPIKKMLRLPSMIAADHSGRHRSPDCLPKK